MKPCDIWKYAGTVWLCNHRVEAVDMFQMADWISGNKNETFHVTSQPLDILYNSTQMMYTRRNQFETVSTSLIDTVLLDIVRESSKTFSLKTQPLLVHNFRTQLFPKCSSDRLWLGKRMISSDSSSKSADRHTSKYTYMIGEQWTWASRAS